MIEEFSEEFVPTEILHREEQMEKIREVFKNFKISKMGTNLVILGCTGSGKTTIIKKVIREEDNSIYISCNETKTCYKTIKAIFSIQEKTHQRVLELTIKKLKENPKILVLDEIDKIDRADEFKMLMDDLNTIYRKTMIPIILVTLKIDIVSTMQSDVRKTLLPERITLPSYNATELKDILRSRIKNLNLDSKIDDGTINYISAIASRQGSARLLINLTLRCIQKNNFTFEYIDEVYSSIIKEEWIGFIDNINENEKEFLRTILELGCTEEEHISAEEVENKLGLSTGRISQIISNFEDYSILKSWHENLGRAGGRKRLIKFKDKEIFEGLNKEVNFDGKEVNN
jgi:cell division control protein 6